MVKLRNLVQEAWRQIDVELHRRHDLVPNLVETVRGYAGHEREVFEAVAQARAAAAVRGAGPAQQAQSEQALSSALSRLFAVAEAYPELRASQTFADLQAELTNTEDRIAAGRRFYNANVRQLNTKIETSRRTSSRTCSPSGARSTSRPTTPRSAPSPRSTSRPGRRPAPPRPSTAAPPSVVSAGATTLTATPEVSEEEVGVGPWPGGPQAWPRDPRLDPELLAEGDRRNVVDEYRYWRLEAIVEDIDARR